MIFLKWTQRIKMILFFIYSIAKASRGEWESEVQEEKGLQDANKLTVPFPLCCLYQLGNCKSLLHITILISLQVDKMMVKTLTYIILVFNAMYKTT